MLQYFVVDIKIRTYSSPYYNILIVDVVLPDVRKSKEISDIFETEIIRVLQGYTL